MPADRTKSTQPACDHLNEGDASANMQSISFAPNVTPVTFNGPPAVDTAESTLFPPSADCPSLRRQGHGHGQKKPDNHIPRPPNAFILFRSSFIKNQHVSTEVETNHSTLSKIIGLTWQNLPHEERQIWHAKAKIALDEHKRRYPQYAFKPLHARGKAQEKRKVREVGPKDLKRCEKIAELLVVGMKGRELDAAIKEFDATHVPEVVTRFEAPITARMYRRGSSAPAPDTDKSTESFTPSSSPPRRRKTRASSSQPTRQTTPAPSLASVCSPAPTQTDSQILGDTQTHTFTPSQQSFDLASFPPEHCPSASPCTDLMQLPGAFDFYNHPQTHSDPLSINTSAHPLDTQWTLCSSPSSDSIPTTPESYSAIHSPIDQYSAFGPFDPFQAMPDLQLYSDAQSHTLINHLDFTPYHKDFSDFHPQGSKLAVAQMDLEFTAFMSSLPAYPA